MNSAINGALQSLDHIQLIWPRTFQRNEADTRENLGARCRNGMGRYSDISDWWYSCKAGIKAGDYIIKIGKEKFKVNLC